MHKRPHRLPKDRYIGERTVVYHLCVQNRVRLFEEQAVVLEFVRCLSVAVSGHDCIVPVYCFMPDHVHIMVRGLHGTSNSLEAISRFKHRTAMWMVRKGLDARWQANFYDHVLRAGDDWHSQARYIAMTRFERSWSRTGWTTPTRARSAPIWSVLFVDLLKVLADVCPRGRRLVLADAALRWEKPPSDLVRLELADAV